MNAKVFLSGSDVQREALRTVAQDLRDLGFEVLSSWLDGRLKDYAEAVSRWTDFLSSDIIVVFDSTPNCMIELGAAKALAHRIVGVGLVPGHDDAYAFLPDTTHFTDYEAARREFFEKPSTLRILRRDK